MLAHISLPAVRAFEAAARRGSFRAAAAELNLSPSAVSHAIVKLEKALGVALFERSGRSMALTIHGETLMHHVRNAFDELRRGLESVSAQGPQLLRVHSAPSFAAAWLTPRLPAFLAQHPGIELRLAAGTDYTRFTGDDFDVDIVYGPVRGDGLATIEMPPETVTPLCAPALAASIGSLADLLRAKLIHSDNKQVRWNHWFSLNGISAPAPQGIRFDRSFLALAAASDGLGVALESTLLAEREIRAGRLVAPLAGRAQDVSYVGHRLVFPKLHHQRRIVRSFVDWLQHSFADGPNA
ncbi:LysR substrate-binding domain-containing protein [Bosea sp. (in: a-proteobacteria)]|uniref:LysR substrate-binding domain-containing protein n=1 Tax=Bosea sp. (in: a-proteobacteria) TaxID=1871050 RepID=UPI0027351A3D|nr:LysR substrate-binding domain-containing protein [Bosea sp. (in: a-proteobacteria)]MDP3411515.1 LysR substrate-binding domain-containing protein [Bosea sp. (in: a-proteobacteria)]